MYMIRTIEFSCFIYMQLVLLQVSKIFGFVRTHNDREPVSDVESNDLFAVQVPPVRDPVHDIAIIAVNIAVTVKESQRQVPFITCDAFLNFFKCRFFL
jgi:hypothetical protein